MGEIHIGRRSVTLDRPLKERKKETRVRLLQGKGGPGGMRPSILITKLESCCRAVLNL
jgi:hypothetical protein